MQPNPANDPASNTANSPSNNPATNAGSHSASNADSRRRRVGPSARTAPELDLRAPDEADPRAVERAVDALEVALIASPNAAESNPRIALMREVMQLRTALGKARSLQAELHEIVDELSAQPWPVARLIGVIDTEGGSRALVHIDGARRLVVLHGDTEAEDLSAGDAVFLSADRNVVMGWAGKHALSGGELATFERVTPDGRLVLRARDEERVVERAAELAPDALRAGDAIRWDRAAEMALERFDSPKSGGFLIEQVQDASPEQIGGIGAIFDTLYSAIALPLLEPEAAAELELHEPPLALLHGPAGCGKTLIARTIASELKRKTGRPCAFAAVRPGEFQNAYVGETEARIRDCFTSLSHAAVGGLGVLFLDELESIGRTRGGTASQHADRALAALLAEIDGFEQRPNIALIAASNRPDLLDPALRSRFSDNDVAVPRPNMQAARAILGLHLSPALRFAPNERDSQALREEAIEGAVSRLYAPNADGPVARLRLRDGATRDVHARELTSGRSLAQIARNAKRRALRRRHEGGTPHLEVADVERAVARSLEQCSALLTPHNAHAQLDDLAPDASVVRVETLRSQTARALRIAHVA